MAVKKQNPKGQELEDLFHMNVWPYMLSVCNFFLQKITLAANPTAAPAATALRKKVFSSHFRLSVPWSDWYRNVAAVFFYIKSLPKAALASTGISILT